MFPVAVTAAVSPFTRPVMEASALVSGVPSYSLAADPVVTAAGAGVTVSVPFSVRILVKLAVTSFPSGSKIRTESILHSLEPASVLLPLKEAV